MLETVGVGQQQQDQLQSGIITGVTVQSVRVVV